MTEENMSGTPLLPPLALVAVLYGAMLCCAVLCPPLSRSTSNGEPLPRSEYQVSAGKTQFPLALQYRGDSTNHPFHIPCHSNGYFPPSLHIKHIHTLTALLGYLSTRFLF